MGKSRIKNTILNSIVGIVNYILIIIASFVVRKIFAVRLGEEYLGLSSLFTSIITFLSLTELGIGSAMVFFLYRPIHEEDHQTTQKYLAFYKKAYLLIAGIILILGLATAFVIPLFAKTSIERNKVIIYFVLYVVNSAVSYLFAYKKSVLYADQNSKVVIIVHGTTKILSNFVQIILLLCTQSFLLYIISMIIFTAIDNIVCTIYVNKHYPFAKQKCNEKFTKEERKCFFGKVIPVFLQNLCSTIVVSSDSIITSALFSVALVGLYSNYTLITQTLKTLYSQVFSAFTNSFGNLAISEDKAKCLQVYFVLSFEVAVVICCNYYFVSMNVPAVSVQNATGLHNKDVWVMIIQAVLNIVLSILLGKWIGLIGVVLATVISTIVCPLISKEYVIYKHLFQAPVGWQYLRQLGYFIFTVILCCACYTLFNILITKITVWIFLLQIIGTILFSLGVMILVFCKTANFKHYIGVLKNLLKHKSENEVKGDDSL